MIKQSTAQQTRGCQQQGSLQSAEARQGSCRGKPCKAYRQHVTVYSSPPTDYGSSSGLTLEGYTHQGSMEEEGVSMQGGQKVLLSIMTWFLGILSALQKEPIVYSVAIQHYLVLRNGYLKQDFVLRLHAQGFATKRNYRTLAIKIQGNEYVNICKQKAVKRSYPFRRPTMGKFSYFWDDVLTEFYF